MKKIYYLKTCSTCKKILKEINDSEYILQEVKTNPITFKQLEELYQLTGSYEALFSKRAKKYQQMDLKTQKLTEEDYKQLLLQEYTFLKRPVIINKEKVYIGNTQKLIVKQK